MRMLQWINGKIRQKKVKNEIIIQGVGVKSIVEKMEKNRLRWFEHVTRRPIDFVARIDQIERRDIISGRSKKNIREVIRGFFVFPFF